jgi:RNA polymerase sigma-70 factor (ECF subfamily)
LLACHASLYRYARALCHEPAKAEELVQETYMRALKAKRHPEADSIDQVRPWAFTIMRNIWRNELRHARHEARQEFDHEALPSGEAASPEVVLRRKLLRSEIVHAIDSLPGAYREVVALREMEGLSYEEIGRVLDCPRGTVMSRLSRARQLLRRMLSRFAPSSWEVER